MSHASQPSSHEPSNTSEAIAHDHNPMGTYLKVFAVLIVLLLVTVLATYLPTKEPWSFLLALAIAVVKAVVVILFFMHVKEASRVTWLFCGCSFLWLVIMLALTFSDYVTRVPVKGPASADAGAAPAAQVSTAEH